MRFPMITAGLAAASLLVPAMAEVPLPNVERLQSSPVLQHLKKNPQFGQPSTAPEATVSQMYVPEGFRVGLVVGEPDLHQPVAFAFDDRGRIWVAEAYSYPQKRPAGQGLDKIVIFEDRDGDGKFESRKVFAESLNLVSGFEVGYGGVWVGAAPELLFIPDRDHDDVPDGPPQVMLEGFGFQDTHECLNSFMWGPDGWLYGNQGVFNYSRIGRPGSPENRRVEMRAGVWRFHPVRHEFEVFADGGSNQWGLDYDERGQIFMTHCRSYWGRGGTSHVIQGGHFWNQANANHAPYIMANPPNEYPEFRNYLLASARYDHGAGGAGAPGSDAIYGGHSHVGTMIYLGDNWPDEYRGHLFTHNLHGHQINQQVNLREGSGFNTVHAGKDQLFCSDPKYVAVDLQYGPDGAVYFIDWYDQQHCHNPNTERWDRSNGRIYRMEWAATYRPVKVDLGSKADGELVGLLDHKNAWYGRTARRLLSERAATKPIDRDAVARLAEATTKGASAAARLNALWTLHGAGRLTDGQIRKALADTDDFVRGWGIQLACESQPISSGLLRDFVRMAASDPSPVVRLFLASAIQRAPEASAWKLIEALSRHGEDREDRNLPLLLWQGLAPRMSQSIPRALAIADRSPIPQLADFANWYAATMDGEGTERAIASLSGLPDEKLRRRLTALGLAVEARGRVAMPAAWGKVAPGLYRHSDARIVRQAEEMASVFGDASMFPRLRETLADTKAAGDARRHAFNVLRRGPDPASLNVFLGLLDDATLRVSTIGLLGRFDDPRVPEALVSRYEGFNSAERMAALNTLVSRAPFALALLDAVAAGTIKRNQLTAFQVRQLSELKNAEVSRRVAASWGRVLQTPTEKLRLIDGLEKTFNEAPLWAYDSEAGRVHFQKLCAQCHRIGPDGVRLGPELTGAGRNGVRYLLENIIDPNAVIGTDFQMTTIETRGGDVVSGLILNDAGGAVTVRTTAGESVIPRADIATRVTSEKSLMPEGLLESIGAREQIELLKFLTTH